MVDERGAQARTHGAGVTGAIECRYYGRDFTAGEMALLRALIAGPPPLNRHMLSKEFCRRIGWFKPDGGLKDMMARVAMLAMHRDGLIALPAPQGRQNRPRPVVFGPDTEAPLFPAPTTLDKVRPLDLRPVVRGTRESKLWNEFVARYHYLGYKTLVGAQMRYAVHDRDGWPLAMLGFSTAAWKLAPRDNFIGWTRQKREKNLPFVVDNPRFLILPWINIPNLGSHILAIIRRRLPDDWTERYNTTPVLIETFVETPRYTGAVYRASGWTRVGTTQGRGRYDRDRQSDKPKKDVWLRPLRRDWKRTLNRQNRPGRMETPALIPRPERTLTYKETIGERLERDRQVLLPLPPAPYDACDKRPGRASSLSLVRYRSNDYSVPVAYGHREVLIRGYVDEVVISCGAEVIARHRRSYDSEDLIFDPLHYLPLIEQKIGALDQAAPLAGWDLPEAFITLRRLLEARMGKAGKREYVQVLRLLETFRLEEVEGAVGDALRLGAIGFDAVKHLVLCRIERRPPRLNLDVYPYLPRARVAMTSAKSYMSLLSGLGA